MIHQIYYRPEQKSYLLKNTEPYFNQEVHPTLENRVILKIEPESYTGVLSWRFAQKHPKSKKVSDLKGLAAGYDLVTFFAKNKCKNQVAYLSANMNYDFKKVLEILLIGTGLYREVEKPTKTVIYQNAFIASEDVFKKYQQVLRTAFLNLDLCFDELMTQSKYAGDVEFVDRLNKAYNLNLSKYPIMPFAFELIPSLFAQYYDLKTKQCW